MRNRWYDPAIARWLTRDPAGYVDGMSLYLYISGNPLAYWDPFGMASCSAVDYITAYPGAVLDTAFDVFSGMAQMAGTNPVTGLPDMSGGLNGPANFATKALLGLAHESAARANSKAVGKADFFDVMEAELQIVTGLGNIADGAAHFDSVRGQPLDGLESFIRIGQGSLQLGSFFLPGTESSSALSGITQTLERAPIQAIETAPIRTAPYAELSESLAATGIQANHLNQNAAFRAVIPKEQGVAAGLTGDALRDIGSPHYEFHSSLEGFWSQYRTDGSLTGSIPTNAQYGDALSQALRRAGHTPDEASYLAGQAALQRSAYGLRPDDPVPRVPGRLPQAQP